VLPDRLVLTIAYHRPLISNCCAHGPRCVNRRVGLQTWLRRELL
jgi:hypothetical protein